MALQIQEITNKETWEKILMECDGKTFLQSWNWGEFNLLESNKIWRWGIYGDGELVAVALIVKITAKRGTFLFVPHGPVVKLKIESQKLKVFELLAIELWKLAKHEKADFVRIAPILEKNAENSKIFRDLKFWEAPIHMHPEITWELDIKKSDEDILVGMRKTTRYLIKQAQKNKDIEIVQSQSIEDLRIFEEVYAKTAFRHNFTPFSEKYLENELSVFAKDNQISIFLGKYKNQVVCASMIIFWQGIGFYHQGASLAEFNKIPVSYLLQFEAIKEAKKRGCQKYNFWGISPLHNTKHPWHGLSLFKIGFGGYQTDYVKTQDFAITQKYYLNYIIERVRRIKRHL